MGLNTFKIIADIQSGIDAASVGGDLSAGVVTIESLMELILNILTTLVGALAVMYIVIAAIKYIISGGDEKKVANAKNTLLYAIVGLVVAIAARLIIGLVLNALNLGGTSGVTG
ncbi:pilin [Candidatus Saccharibacteria bacterium]|nr:pilin [Candidatus Saccharibacteria bacterium]